MECPKCEGKGWSDKVVSNCHKAMSECCGGCTEKYECELCDGCGYFSGDLFEMWDEHPEFFDDDVKSILYEMDEISCNKGLDYKDCQTANNLLKPLGFQFEYGLDATPYNLHKI